MNEQNQVSYNMNKIQQEMQKDIEMICFKEVNNLVKRLREDDGRTLDFMLLYQTVCTVINGNLMSARDFRHFLPDTKLELPK